MLSADRLRARMELFGLSQSELARRVGISQQTVAHLVSGQAFGSKHLHQIARELETTSAYLMGETDDPNSDSPVDRLGLSGEERQLIEYLRGMAAEDRRAILRLSRTAAHSPEPEPVAVESNAENAQPANIWDKRAGTGIGKRRKPTRTEDRAGEGSTAADG